MRLVNVIHIQQVGIPVFGPSRLAAQMEGSKAFSKAFMDRHNIPTARFRVFASTEYKEAITYVKTCGFQVVLKASGLAAGKGVLIPETIDEAIAGLKEIMVDAVFGSAGPRPCRVYIAPPIHAILPLRQATRSLLKSSSLAPKFLSSRSLTDILSSPSPLLRITNVSVKVTSVLTPAAWVYMLLLPLPLPRSWTVS